MWMCSSLQLSSSDSSAELRAFERQVAELSDTVSMLRSSLATSDEESRNLKAKLSASEQVSYLQTDIGQQMMTFSIVAECTMLHHHKVCTNLKYWNSILCACVQKLEELKRLKKVSPEELKSAREEGYRTGFEAGKASGGGGGASFAEVSAKVKSIMNKTYQMLAASFKKKASFTSKEALDITLAAIRVSIVDQQDTIVKRKSTSVDFN